MSLIMVSVTAFAGTGSFEPMVGQTVMFKNPWDRVPPRKAVVTKADDTGYTIEFREFFPELNATDKEHFVMKSSASWLSPSTTNAPDGHAILLAQEEQLTHVSGLFGNWAMSIAGDYSKIGEAGNGSMVQVTTTYGAKAGTLTIRPDHTYLWQDPLGTNSGTWRLATQAENPMQKPAIRILEASTSKWDFTICRRADATNGVPESIYIMTSGYSQTGYRMGK